jgi:hypothetical protein
LAWAPELLQRLAASPFSKVCKNTFLKGGEEDISDPRRM